MLDSCASRQGGGPGAGLIAPAVPPGSLCNGLPACQSAAAFYHALTAQNVTDQYVDVVLGGDTVNANRPNVLLRTRGQALAVAAYFRETYAGAASAYVQDVLVNGKSITPPGYVGPDIASMSSDNLSRGLNLLPQGLPAFSGNDADSVTVRLGLRGTYAPNDVIFGSFIVQPYYGG